MSNNFLVCTENELKKIIKNSNEYTPKIFVAGYTKFSNWVYEDYSPDCDYDHESLSSVLHSCGSILP